MKVLDIKNIPSRPPTTTTCLVYLFIDKIHVPWVTGMLWTLCAILWIEFIVTTCKEEKVTLDDFVEKGKR
jgi:hypothetical protein